MKDPDDTRDVLLNKLFRFKLKNRFKDNKNNFAKTSFAENKINKKVTIAKGM